MSVEDLADFEVTRADSVPFEVMEALIPHVTPSGRPTRRVRENAGSMADIFMLVARGRIVHPTVPSVAAYLGHPDIVYVPIRDMPPSNTALVRRRADGAPKLHEFIRVAREVLQRR